MNRRRLKEVRGPLWSPEEDALILFLWDIEDERPYIGKILGRTDEDVVQRYYTLQNQKIDLQVRALEEYYPRGRINEDMRFGLQFRKLQLELLRGCDTLKASLRGIFTRK